jgi:hypothetical protein
MLIIITPGMLLLIGIIFAFYSFNEEDKDVIIMGFFRIVGWLLTRLAPPILLFIIGAVYHWPGSAAPLATLGWWVYLAVRRSRRKARARAKLDKLSFPDLYDRVLRD